MLDYISKRIVAAALSSASVIIMLQATILPGIFDFLTDLVLLAIIWLVGTIAKEKRSG